CAKYISGWKDEYFEFW
nr:immunoglobulin heavy chain junction region [Macaca mulatta]